MARDKGNFYEASDWFKEALQINQVLCHQFFGGVNIWTPVIYKMMDYLLLGTGSSRCLVSDREPPLGQAGMGTGSKEV